MPEDNEGSSAALPTEPLPQEQRKGSDIELRRFRDLENVDWNGDSITSVFKRLISISNDAVKRIRDPLKYHGMLETQVKIWTLLRRCENSRPASDLLVGHSQWITHAMQRSGRDYSKGRRTGFQQLMLMLKSWEADHLMQAYQDEVISSLQDGLEYDDPEISRILLEGLANLFATRKLRGIMRLVDPSLATLERIVLTSSQDYHRIGQHVKISGLNVVGSILPFLGESEFPGRDSSFKIACSRPLRAEIISICLGCISAEDPQAGNSMLVRIAVSFLNTLLFESILSTRDTSAGYFNERCAAGILSAFTHPNPLVSKTATSCFVSLGRGLNYSTRAREVVDNILDRLFQKVFHLLHQRLDWAKDMAITMDQIYSICGWLEHLGPPNPKRGSNGQLLGLLERCVQYRRSDNGESRGESVDFGDGHIPMRPPTQSSGDRPSVASCAENVLVILSKYMSSRASTRPPGSDDVAEPDPDDHYMVFFTRAKGLLMISLNSSEVLKVIYRDKTGKYSWECNVEDFGDTFRSMDIERNTMRSSISIPAPSSEMQRIEQQLPWLLSSLGHKRFSTLLRQ